MSTEYGTIKSARYENVMEIYTSNGIVLWTHKEEADHGEKMVLDETNIDEFLAALVTAIAYYNISSDYLK
jgi:hypothetical protein